MLDYCHFALFVFQGKCKMIISYVFLLGDETSTVPPGSLRSFGFCLCSVLTACFHFHRESEQHGSNQETLQQRRWCNNFHSLFVVAAAKTRSHLSGGPTFW